MRALIEVNRARVIELAVLELDGLLILRDAVDGAVVAPVLEDADRLAAHGRIRLRSGGRRGRLAGLGQRHAADEQPRSRRGREQRHDTGRCGGGRGVTGARLRLAERHERAIHAARIGHDDLFRGPEACDVGVAVRKPRGARARFDADRRRALAVPVERAAVGENERADVASRRLVAVGRALDRHLLADGEQLRHPARAAQRRCRAHLAAHRHARAVGTRHVEVEPRVRD